MTGPNTERMASCYCGATRPSTERDNLAFFEDRGPGSDFAKRSCKKCGCYASAHEPSERWTPTGYPTVIGQPHAFEAGRILDFDSFYCGCGGWD